MRARLIFIVLAAVAIGLWSQLLKQHQPEREATGCPVSSEAPNPQTAVSFAALEPVLPITPDAVEVGVLNATNRRGLAAQVTDTLHTYGFAKATMAGNDLLHPPGSMQCRGQLRFGPHGAAAARTLSLILPCVELVDDQRPDGTVDLVLGAAFTAIDPDPAARTVLTQLHAAASNQTQPAALQSIAGATPTAQTHPAEC